MLKKEPRNIYAAHGIGCILALEGRLAEAKDVFVSVREAESEIPEPWVNLAHVYLEQKNYVNAVKLYVCGFVVSLSRCLFFVCLLLCAEHV